MSIYGPGYHRMQRRLGKASLEQMRQDTLQRQEAALRAASAEHVTPRDRETYRDYPPPKQRKRRVPTK